MQEDYPQVNFFNDKFDQLASKSAELAKSVVPIFIKTGLTFRFVGSSIYLSVGSDRWLVSAGHVMKELSGQEVCCPGSGESIVEIPTNEFLISKYETIDLAACRILSPLDFYRPFDIFHARGFQSNGSLLYIIAGFPSSKTKPRVSQIDQKLMSLVAEESKPSSYDYHKIDKATSFLLEFSKEQGYARDMEKMVFPDLWGMSGGAVFSFLPEFPRLFSLVGIITDWHQSPTDCVQCLNIEAAVSLVLSRDRPGYAEMETDYAKMYDLPRRSR